MRKNLLYMILFFTFISFNVNAQNSLSDYSNIFTHNSQAKTANVIPEKKPVDVIAQYSNVVKKIQNNIETSRADRASITDTIDTLNEIKTIAKTQISLFEDEIIYINKNLEVIGPKPKDQEEAEGIAKLRNKINKEYSEKKSNIAEIQIFITKINEIEDKLLQYRNKAIINNLFSRQPSLLTPQVIIDAVRGFFRFTMDIISSPKSWYDDLSDRNKRLIKMNIFPVLLILVLAYLVGRYLQRFLMKKFGYKQEIQDPSYSRKFVASIFVAISYGILPATIISAFLLWLSAPDAVVNGFFAMVLSGMLLTVLFVVLIGAFSRAICCPYNEKWRLVKFTTDKARKVNSAIKITAIVVGVTYFLEYLVLEAGYTAELRSLLVTAFVVLKSFCIILLTKSFFWESSDDEEFSDEDEEEDDGRILSNGVKSLFFISTILFVSVVMALVGYTTLSAFILDRLLLSALVIGLLFLMEAACDEMIIRIMRRSFWRKKLKIRKKVLRKVELVLTVTNDPIFILFGLFVLLPIWGVPNELIKVGVVKLFTGFSVGGVTISLIDITLSIAVFFASITLVKVMKTKLMENVLSKMDIDDGLKHSLVSGFGFLGFILALTMAIAVVGIDLTNLALIAGALSFGIGLGLQNVVNNFVSGFIILFERPIKVGDWVVINGQEGIVKQINIRATELETWTKSNIIIPNADILSNPVVNYTHDDKFGRVDVAVGVAYGTDVEKVRNILLDVARSNKRIMKKPEPYVLFQDFGDSSLNFEVRAFTADVMNRMSVATAMRFEIDRIFREEKIEIPFPQRVVHMAK